MFNNKSPALSFRRLDTTVLTRAKYQNSANIIAQNTRRNLLTTADSYNDYLKKNKDSISPQSITAFLEQQKTVLAPTTWNLTRQNLKTSLKLQPKISSSYPLKMLVEEIFRDIKPIKVDRKVNDYLTSSQIEKLATDSSKPLGLMIRFLFMTGCRISELIGIRLMDIKIAETVTISLIGKGNKQRRVFIPLELLVLIRKEFCGNNWLFETPKGRKYNRSTIWRQLKRAGIQILGREIHPHLLRHSTANHLINHGKSPKYVSVVLGHSSSKITSDLYIHEQPQADIITLFA